MCNTFFNKFKKCAHTRTHIFYTEKQSSIKSRTEIIKSEKFEAKTICKYTAKSHIKIAKINEVIRVTFSATSPDQMREIALFKSPPPSRIDTGYRLISAKEKFHTAKKLHSSELSAGIKATNTPKARLKSIPPACTAISLP